jgi:hypothetical protein
MNGLSLCYEKINIAIEIAWILSGEALTLIRT